jgi:energy-coupling factor transporter transmembrane protein EcfT
MEARGYVIGGKRTNIDELKFRWKDLIAFVCVLSILTMSILLMVGL